MSNDRSFIFQPGDSVQLKSGGPAMTVKKHDGNGDAVCVWFYTNGECHEKEFPEFVLKAIPTEGAKPAKLKPKSG